MTFTSYNDLRAPFRAFVANLGKYTEGETIGEWVNFPINEDEKAALFVRLKLAHYDEPAATFHTNTDPQTGEVYETFVPRDVFASVTYGYTDPETGEVYEEYVILDYDTYNAFPVDKLGEHETVETLNDYAERFDAFLDDQKLAFRAACEEFETLDEAFDIIQNGNYVVHANCEDMADVARDYVEDSGLLRSVPENLRDYFDFAAFGRDMEIEGTFVFLEDECVCVEFYY